MQAISIVKPFEIEVREVPMPEAKEGEALLQVLYCGICGMEKLMWGSDYPRTMTAITYRMSWDFIAKSPLLTAEEKQAFLHGNAHAFYRFGALPELPAIRHMAE